MAHDDRRRMPRPTRATGLLAGSAVLLLLGGCAAGASADDGAATPTVATTSMLVIGDSYAAGLGADSPSTSFAWETGSLLGWTTTVDGVSGTGYVNPGASGQTYAERLALLSDEAVDVDVIVVEGGLNDRPYGAEEVTAAATSFLQTLRARAPEATIVVVGAPDPVPSLAAASVTVNAEIAAAAALTGVTFIDPVAEGWITEANAGRYVSVDQLHPDQAGHDHIADLLAADLRVIVGQS
jgi:lysophospholipase L1-like esterase